jgi:hypothetical protein
MVHSQQFRPAPEAPQREHRTWLTRPAAPFRRPAGAQMSIHSKPEQKDRASRPVNFSATERNEFRAFSEGRV